MFEVDVGEGARMRLGLETRSGKHPSARSIAARTKTIAARRVGSDGPPRWIRRRRPGSGSACLRLQTGARLPGMSAVGPTAATGGRGGGVFGHGNSIVGIAVGVGSPGGRVGSPSRVTMSGGTPPMEQSVGVAVGKNGVGHGTRRGGGGGSPARIGISGAVAQSVGVATAASGAPAGSAHAPASRARTQSTINQRIPACYPRRCRRT